VRNAISPSFSQITTVISSFILIQLCYERKNKSKSMIKT
jgi:hypothetical protein